MKGFIIWQPFTIPVFIVIEFRFAKLVLIFIVSTAFKIYRRSVLSICSTWGSVAEDSAGNRPLSATTKSSTNYLAVFSGSIFFLCGGTEWIGI